MNIQQPIKKGYLKNIPIPDCRFIYARETIYPTDYIGALDISPKAHDVLYESGIFFTGQLFNLEKDSLSNLKNADKEAVEEILSFIAREKPLAGKILGDEDSTNYIQKLSWERQEYRMRILKKAYSEIPANRLDKPLTPFLHDDLPNEIQHSIIRLSPLLKKIDNISDLKMIFPFVAQSSRTNDLVRILKYLSINLIEMLNEAFLPFFSNPRYAESLDILSQRAEGLTLQDLAKKRKITRERVRQKEKKSADRLLKILNAFPIDILSFICFETGNSGYISTGFIREYLEDFSYTSELIYRLRSAASYKDYQYDSHYDVFYLSSLDIDFSSIQIKKSERKTIVKIEKGRHIQRSCIVDMDNAADTLLAILQNQFRQFHGYSNRHILFEAARINLAMFMNGNGFKTERSIYMLAKHLFFKENFNGYHFHFIEGRHIWEKKMDFPQINKGVLINLARANGGILAKEVAEKYLDKLKLPKTIIMNKIRTSADSTFYFYTKKEYILSEYLHIDDNFIAIVNKALNKLFDKNFYVIPRDIDEAWFDMLPKLPPSLNWSLLLLQEVIRYNDQIAYKLLFADLDQAPYRIAGAIVKSNLNASLVDIIYHFAQETLSLPCRIKTEGFRLRLRDAGFIANSEWCICMSKVFHDSRFVFTDDDKTLLIRKVD